MVGSKQREEVKERGELADDRNQVSLPGMGEYPNV